MLNPSNVHISSINLFSLLLVFFFFLLFFLRFARSVASDRLIVTKPMAGRSRRIIEALEPLGRALRGEGKGNAANAVFPVVCLAFATWSRKMH